MFYCLWRRRRNLHLPSIFSIDCIHVYEKVGLVLAQLFVQNFQPLLISLLTMALPHPPQQQYDFDNSDIFRIDTDSICSRASTVKMSNIEVSGTMSSVRALFWWQSHIPRSQVSQYFKTRRHRSPPYLDCHHHNVCQPPSRPPSRKQ